MTCCCAEGKSGPLDTLSLPAIDSSSFLGFLKYVCLNRQRADPAQIKHVHGSMCGVGMSGSPSACPPSKHMLTEAYLLYLQAMARQLAAVAALVLLCCGAASQDASGGGDACMQVVHPPPNYVLAADEYRTLELVLQVNCAGVSPARLLQVIVLFIKKHSRRARLFCSFATLTKSTAHTNVMACINCFIVSIIDLECTAAAALQCHWQRHGGWHALAGTARRGRR